MMNVLASSLIFVACFPDGVLAATCSARHNIRTSAEFYKSIRVSQAECCDLCASDRRCKTAVYSPAGKCELHDAKELQFLRSPGWTVMTVDPAPPSPGPSPKGQNIVELAEATPELSTLVKALAAGGLTSTLAGTGPFTVFAPTNAAFAKLDDKALQALLADKAELDKVLEYHVLAAKFTMRELMTVKIAKTLEGENVNVSDPGGSIIKVNNAKVVKANVGASNGFVHIIDTVLQAPALPPHKVRLALFSAQTNIIMPTTTTTTTAMDCDDCHLDCYLNDDESSYDIDIDDSDRVDCTADIRRAVSVNNGGTELLRDRRYQAAVKSFTSVLTILKPLAAIVEGNNTANGNDGNGYYHSNDSNNSDSGNPASSMPLSMNFAAGSSSGSGNDGETSRRHHRHQEGPVDNDSGDIDMMDAASAAATRRSSLSSDNNKRKKDEGERAESLQPATSSSPSATKRLSPSSPPPLAKKRLGYFVFRDPVEIPIESVPRTVSIPIAPTADPQDGSDGLSSSDLFSKFIMIVMYNLALTLHLQAIEADDGDCAENNSKTGGRRSGINRRAKRLFARARKLYELAFEMHLDESCEDVNLLFTLALINNLGLIYDRTGETSRSETCFGNMLSTMMYLTDSNESSNVKQWDGLLSNVMEILFFKKKVMYEVAAPAA